MFTSRKEKKKFPGIAPATLQHPTDKAALSALHKLPGLDAALKKVIGVTSEQSLRLLHLASAVRISTRQYAKINVMLDEALHILDMKEKPEMYVASNPFLNAGVVGVEKPFIVLNSSVLEMEDDEVRGIIGHELGHCMCGHALYKTLLHILLKASFQGIPMPFAGPALLPVVLALLEWDRKSELTADRASVLVVQNPEKIYSLLMKIAGGINSSQMNIDEFLIQADDYENQVNISDSFHKLMNVFFASHPFPVTRLKHLKAWVDSGDYEKILSGEYQNRENCKEESVYGSIRGMAESYKQDLRESKDPLADLATNFLSTFGSVKGKTKEKLESLRDYTQNRKSGDEEQNVDSGDAANHTLEALDKLGKLKLNGTISNEEFQALKKKIMNSF